MQPILWNSIMWKKEPVPILIYLDCELPSVQQMLLLPWSWCLPVKYVRHPVQIWTMANTLPIFNWITAFLKNSFVFLIQGNFVHSLIKNNFLFFVPIII